MASSSSSSGGVPPGFRFHPTDEELLHYYLKKKVTFQKFDMEVIREVDLNRIEPWDLQERCRIGSTPQNEWYFFSHKDRKYPTGSRTNRATNAGFWKATGRDKCIRNSFKKIGMRKTLVFYRGRAPHGQKTDWIMHEYRLEDATAIDDTTPPPPNDNNPINEDGWVICRVFKKKNLFKVGNELGGGGGAAANMATNDHHQLNSITSTSHLSSSMNINHYANQTVGRQYFTNHHHYQYLLQQPPGVAAGDVQLQTPFDLYKSCSNSDHHRLALNNINYSDHHMIPLPNYHHHPNILQAQNLIPITHDDYSSPVKQLMMSTSNHRDCESGSHEINLRTYDETGGLEVGTSSSSQNQLVAAAGGGRSSDEKYLNEWGMLQDRLNVSGNTSANPHLGLGQSHEDSSKQMNQLSLRGEMDLWGTYGK